MMLLDTIPAAPLRARSPDSSDSAGLTNNPEIRQEMIRLINQTQKDNGVNELDFGIQKEVNQFPK